MEPLIRIEIRISDTETTSETFVQSLAIKYNSSNEPIQSGDGIQSAETTESEVEMPEKPAIDEPEKSIHIKFKAIPKRILFESYFEIIAKNGDTFIAVCNFCKSSLRINVSMCGNLTRHLKVRTSIWMVERSVKRMWRSKKIKIFL